MLAPASNTSQKAFQEPKTGHLRYNSTTLHKINTIYINVLYGLKMVRPQVKTKLNPLERLLDNLSYEAPDRSGESILLDAAYVDQHLEALASNEDLSRFIL